MDNQHREISGYRELNQTEIDLINEAKELEARVLDFHYKVREVLVEQAASESSRQVRAQCFRWHSIAQTNIETGFMALVRSIAQPQPK